MDYEQKYNEALERAKKEYKNHEAFKGFCEMLVHIFPELKESEDEQIRKELLEHCINRRDGKQVCVDANDYRRWADWLEKQGEQKLQDKSALEVIKEENVDNAKKVESKFHEGDFIKHNKINIICKVISVNSGSYYVENIETSSRIELFNAEQNFHLWSIEDAKDGDVLATDKGVFIYAKLLYNKPYAYCGVDKFGVFKDNCLNNNWTNSVDNIYPATKEQHDLLFANIHEAGYEWNFDKRELTKE